ncbi:hypothetical protein [Flavobacterium fluviale]|uniref:hypothetical protein n=1 Tax=Flavobacterium fluviale TaxID=2249356 RepID=UPI001E3CBC75|nr:hypothetical protein [Flavobacterium fluviale]
MKTNISIRQNSNHFYLLGLLSLLLASCGSYQNSSYHDNDGVYGNSSSNRYVQQSSGTNNQYKDYFRSLQDDNQPTEIFTDVDNYTNYAENDSTQTASVGYPAWGSSNSEVSVNVYSDPTWSFGFGMGYPYYGWGYGGYWGWGYPGYWGGGWGYPSYWDQAGVIQDIGEAAITATTITTTATEEEVLLHIMETEIMLLTEITLRTEGIHQTETTLQIEIRTTAIETTQQIDLLTAIAISEEAQL